MKVVLSTLNAKYIHSSLALRYIKSYAATKGQELEIAEYTINMPIYDILRHIDDLKCDAIGFACYIWNIEMTLHLTKLLHLTNPNLKIILGGPEVSYCADEILTNNPEISFVVQGEGEECFTELIAELKNGNDKPHIKGIRGRMHTGELFGSLEIAEVDDLGAIPFPYTPEDLQELKHRIIYYESSRGCPFSCQYCLSGNKNQVRFFPQERVLQEIKWFAEHNVKQVKFVDRTFNCNARHHLPVMEFIRSLDTTTNFHLEMEGVLLSAKEVDILNTAPKDRFQIEIGVQSTNDQTLQAIKRKNVWEHICNMVTPIIKGGRTHVHMDLIVGLPYENYSIFQKSFNDLYSLQPQALQIGFLKLLKGSGVRNMTEYDYRHDLLAPYEVLSNHVLSYAEIKFLKVFEDVFETFYNGEKYPFTFGYIYEQLKDQGNMSFFDVYELMTKFWIECGYDKIKLNERDRSFFLYAFAERLAEATTAIDMQVLQDLVRLDTVVSYRGKIIHEGMNLLAQEKDLLRETEYFWQNEELVQKHIKQFSFTQWRKIRQNFYEMHISAATLDYLDLPTGKLVIDLTGSNALFTIEMKEDNEQI